MQHFNIGGRACILRPAPILLARHPHIKRWLFLGASYSSLTIAESLIEQGAARVDVYTLGDPPGGLLRLRGRTPGQAECAEVVLQRLDQCRASQHFTMHTEALALEALLDLLDAGAEETGVVLGLLPQDEVADGSLSLLKMLCAGSSRVAYPELATGDPMLCVAGSSLMAVEGALFLQMQGHRVCVVLDEGGVAHDTHEAWSAHYVEVLRSKKIACVNERDEVDASARRWVEVSARLAPHAWEETLSQHARRLTSALYLIEDRYEPFDRLAVLGARRIP